MIHDLIRLAHYLQQNRKNTQSWIRTMVAPGDRDGVQGMSLATFACSAGAAVVLELTLGFV